MTPPRPEAVRDPFRRNAYRVLGLPGEATWSESVRAAERVRGLESWGTWSSPWDLTWLGTVRREPADVDAALARLGDQNQRLVERFFWFHERDAESAVAYLTPASIRDALEGWSTTALAVAKHDAAVVGLVAAVTLDEDVEDPALWSRMLREWSAAIERDDYWLEVLRVEMEGEFETPASLGDLRELRETALGHVAGVLMDRAREAVIDGEGHVASRALAVLREELPTALFDEMCGELANHLWGGVVPAGAKAPKAKSRPKADAPAHDGPAEPPLPWARPQAPAEAGAPPQQAPTSRQRAGPRRNPAAHPASSQAPARPAPPVDPRDARAPSEPDDETTATPDLADEPTTSNDASRAISAHMTRLRAGAKGRPPAGLVPEVPLVGSVPEPELPKIRTQSMLEPIASDPTPPSASPDDASRAEDAALDRPAARPVPREPRRERRPWTPAYLPQGDDEPEPASARAFRMPRVPRRVLAAASVAVAIATVALLAPWPQGTQQGPVAATMSSDPVRATLTARVEAADQAIALLLLERAANSTERDFLRRTIADYHALVDDYHWRMTHGLVYDPAGYQRVRRYLDEDFTQYNAAASEARSVADRYDALIRERSRLVAQYNERVR